jgi:O-antigen ligase
MNKNKVKHYPIIDKIILAIVVLSIALIPLLVRVNMVDNPMSQYSWYSSEQVLFDNYSLIKSEFIVILGIVASALILFRQVTQRSYSLKDPVVIVSLVFVLVTILSHVTSLSKALSNVGSIERYESTWVWLSYLSIFLLVYGENWDIKKLKKLTAAFIISNIILSVIGVFQYLGFDPVFNAFTKLFITDASMNGLSYTADYTINYKVIVQTLYHYNYVGFYIALSFPILMSLTLYEEKRSLKLGYLLLLAVMLFNLLGSSARGGMFGILAITPLFLILNRNLIFKNFKLVIALALILIVVFVGFESFTNGFITSRIKNIFTSIETPNKVIDIVVNESDITYQLQTGEFKVRVIALSDESFEMEYYLNENRIQPVIHESNTYYYFNEIELSDINVLPSIFSETNLIRIDTYGQSWHFGYDDNQSLSYFNSVGKFDKIVSPKTFGFEGRERLGSSRGYIWSRTIPLVFEKPWLGYGIDTYPLAFPQQDYVGKYNAYSTPNMVVDKPHNLFLQIAVNSGLIALACFIILVIISMYRITLILFKNKYLFSNVYHSGLSLSILSYVVASIFNDSTVHVSTVFWVFLGLLLIITKQVKTK